jgi:hypothetical protein
MGAVSRLLLALLFLHAGVSVSLAAWPLLTDDTGTQGKGKAQLEFDNQYEHENDIEEHEIEIKPMLSYGLTDAVDLIIAVPYDSIRTRESGRITKEKGFSDSSLEMKWRFFEKDGLSLAIKPGITLPTGNDDKGFGTGKVDYTFVFIATEELKPWAFHANLGYTLNENSQGVRKDIWSASLAAEYQMVKNLRLVGNIGVQRDDDPVSCNNQAFLLGGIVYSPTERVDVSIGYKHGLTRSEVDHAILAGVAIKL